MTPRSIRRAQERNAEKLARKAEKTALPNRGDDGAAVQSVACEARPLQRVGQPTIRMADVAFLNASPTPEILQEFSPELIAEANAVRERVSRRAVLASLEVPLETEPEASAADPVSAAQLTANRANSQLSTGAKTPQGKQTVSFNAIRHGLAGRFLILPSENHAKFAELYSGLKDEHRPATPTEHLLVEGMAQHYWLAQRALNLQRFCFNESGGCSEEKQLALYLRYQTTHDRAFHKCLNDLLKLRAEKRKEQIGFVSQQHKEADQARREARENRQKDRHGWAALLDQAKLDHQNLVNLQLPGGLEVVKKATQRTMAFEKAAA